jgi:signal transduction histidine kinase
MFGSKHLLLSDSRFLCVIVEQVEGVLQEVRHFSRDLRPSILEIDSAEGKGTTLLITIPTTNVIPEQGFGQ